MKIITMHDILNYLHKPVVMFILGVIACSIAFCTGIKYARNTLEVHSITHHLAFIEIAGEEHMYELDWSEPEPLYWSGTR